MDTPSNIKVHDKYFQPFISKEHIENIIRKMVEEISKDHALEKPLFIAVLNGAFIFASDFFKQLKFDCEISFIKTKSYDGMTSSGDVLQVIGLEENITNRTVIILEDIIDTGLTIKQLLNTLQKQKPATLKIATLLLKPEAIQHQFPIDYIGLEIPTKFVVGYGLDYDGLGRNYPEIYQLVEEV